MLLILDADARIEIYNNIFSILNSKFEIYYKRGDKEIGYSANELSNFKSYIEENETEEHRERLAMLKITNKQISTMEQATPPMNQVK